MSTPTGPPRFLVLDDNADDRLMAVRLLHQAYPDAEADEVFDAPGFERALARGGYAAVVTDYLMRWTDGLQALRRVKRRWPDCPVVLFTSSGNEEVAVEAMKSGADDYVIKSPRHMGRLTHAVRHAVERVTARRQLEAVEARLQNLTDALDVGVFRADPAGELLSCNPAFLRIIGRASPDEARAEDLNDLLHPPGREAAVQEAAGARAMVRRETEVRRPDGSRLWVLVSERVEDDGGRPVVAGLVEDITARKALEQGLRDQAAELREADRRKDEFLAMLAHELRNPMSPIQSAAHVVRLSPVAQADPHVRHSGEVIERQVRALARLVDDLLDVSRVSRGKIGLRFEVVDLGLAVGRAVETARPLIEARRHELTVQPPAGPLPVRADPTRLTQVLANLLNNAAKFTPQGGRIAVEAAREGGRAVVRVRDNGIGIAPELLPRVFDLFTQGEVSIDREQGGLGIGLTLARRLVELHGGTLVAESPPGGRGSTFTVRLPVADRPAPEGPPPAAEATPPPGARLRVLVVDDNRDSADVLAHLLRRMGHEPRTAYDGRSAVEAAREFHPAVVLLDIGLPGLDGYETARAIRQEAGPRVLLVALTGYGTEEDRARSRAAGFDHHLTKPADVDLLKRLLRDFRS